MTIYFKNLGQYGQLGNMLFQMAATIGAAHKYGDNYRFPYLEVLKQLNLPKWSIDVSIPPNMPTYSEPHFHYVSIPRLSVIMNIHGYFQSTRYFENCVEKVKSVLTPKVKGEFEGFTAIHVRRTDYLKHVDCYNILRRENYYNKAMKILPSDKYMIFSDDLDWCKRQFIGNQFHFSEERDPIKDLGNLISCSNFITANSSFSWWGAWLSSNNNKKVVAPAIWFGPQLAPTHNTKDLCPKDWILI